MRNSLVTFVALVWVALGWTQDISLSGSVQDSLGNGIDMANVIAINEATKALESYGITNHQGMYKLKLASGETYQIKVSYLGFKTENFFLYRW